MIAPGLTPPFYSLQPPELNRLEQKLIFVAGCIFASVISRSWWLKRITKKHFSNLFQQILFQYMSTKFFLLFYHMDPAQESWHSGAASVAGDWASVVSGSQEETVWQARCQYAWPRSSPVVWKWQGRACRECRCRGWEPHGKAKFAQIPSFAHDIGERNVTWMIGVWLFYFFGVSR